MRAWTTAPDCYNAGMDKETAYKLAELNKAFYRDNSASFSASRQSPWPGWRRLWRSCAQIAHPARILDVASGNMRFERFLLEEFPRRGYRFTCVDSCPQLAKPLPEAHFIESDVIACLLEGRGVAPLGEGRFEAVVSFGFMHHVPSADVRLSLLQALVGNAEPGGIVAVSFWRFMDDARLALSAQRSTCAYLADHEVALEEGDFILGWNGQPGVYRYCHHFTDEEVDSLLDSVSESGEIVARFNADGRTGALNGYALVRRR